MERPKCKTCPYWKGLVSTEDGGKGGGEGFCRKHAPSPVVEQEEGDAECFVWPWVTARDWCGEHPDFPAYIESLRKATNKTTDGA